MLLPRRIYNRTSAHPMQIICSRFPQKRYRLLSRLSQRLLRVEWLMLLRGSSLPRILYGQDLEVA